MMEHKTIWIGDGDTENSLILKFHNSPDNIYLVEPVLSVSLGNSKGEFSISMEDLIELKCFLDAVISAYNLEKSSPE